MNRQPGREELMQELARRVTPEVVQRVGAKVLFELGEAPGNAWLLDLERPGSPSLQRGEGQAHCTFRIADTENLSRMFRGELTPTAALLGGQLVVEGDLGVAMRVERALFR